MEYRKGISNIWKGDYCILLLGQRAKEFNEMLDRIYGKRKYETLISWGETYFFILNKNAKINRLLNRFFKSDIFFEGLALKSPVHNNREWNEVNCILWKKQISENENENDMKDMVKTIDYHLKYGLIDIENFSLKKGFIKI